MKWRIWLLSLGITLLSVLIFGFASTQVYYNSSIDDGKEYLRVYMGVFDEKIYEFNEDGARAFSQKLGNARVTFMDAQGNVKADIIGDAPATVEPQENHFGRTEARAGASPCAAAPPSAKTCCISAKTLRVRTATISCA